MKHDTIVACATPEGRGGVAIIRISGAKVRKIAKAILNEIPEPRFATLSSFLDESQETIDEGIALFFPGPHSFTGEDVLELHGHGGLFVVNLLIKRIIALGARIAKPGEFSERAFLNDKMDLVQAEAIADLIDAASFDAAKAAVRSLQGEFSKKIQTLVASLIQLRMYVEAAIDFAEEEIDFLQDEKIGHHLQTLMTQLQNIENSAEQGSLLREGIKTVIIGKPNVGKSSLLNVLSGKDIAIVTNIAGTTRDVLRENILIDGMPLHIVDTAGLRESEDIVEIEGIRRAHQEMLDADLILLIKDIQEPLTETSFLPDNTPVIIIRNKIDILKVSPKIEMREAHMEVFLSAKTKEGIDLLKKQIKIVVGLKE
ncbi:MAG TPA: tRNA uridine-5-carboxymethylaminomethyl(34) synthesis GTPase MnmE, partial [Gammaproteobacteria bacterium]|nr:tRNA uridine-5-carboxymethylaminomethyl(34) synthesis GTPase MnmE [Gammaproteobacteria bacterium]